MTPKGQGTIAPVLIAGSIILFAGFAIRASFGVFQIPIATEFGWLRSEFSFAIAIQNLFWGIGTPILGAIADKYGDRKAVIAGALCYAAGLVLSSYAVMPEQHHLLEMLVSFGIAGTGFGVILSVIGRAAITALRMRCMPGASMPPWRFFRWARKAMVNCWRHCRRAGSRAAVWPI